MLAKRLIPCLDVTEGRVVKGTNFVDLIDAGDPVALGKKYNIDGADELVFLDITATSHKRDVLVDLVSRISENIFIPFTVGGGISSVEIMQSLLQAGADKVSVNSAAIQNPNLILEGSRAFGNQCIVLAIDAKRVLNPDLSRGVEAKIALDMDSRWEVYTHGGRKPTGIDAEKWAKYGVELGAGEILLTSMDRDGTKSGYDLLLTQAISQSVKVPVIASGGAGTIQDILDALKICEAALLASLLHFNEMTISEIKKACLAEGISVRI